eukprot:TRINITY_DN1896_c0_g1_i1.p1 TRINITY_DN1896_c0_g1~~TRINITY_DN1896_c0_g1_i1.p1  ORF type:complete len:304 (+),score=54.55 TRINITY_DN1896_c0_g1_i1:21-932(+)
MDLEQSVGVCPDDRSMVGRAKGCEGCPGQEYCQNTGGVDPDQSAIDTRMKVIGRKILVVSGKGGVGKSTVAAQMALGLAARGCKVGILDVDICGPSMPKLFDCEDYNVINQPWGWIPVKVEHDIAIMSIGFVLRSRDAPVLWRGPRKTAMIKRFLKETFWGKLDYLIIDTPPGTSDEHLSIIAALQNSNPDGAVIVTTPQNVALGTIRKELTFCSKLKLPVMGIVENMTGYQCPCCEEITEIWPDSGIKELAEEYNLEILTKIPIDQTISQSGESGQSLFDNHPDSPATKAFSEMITKIHNHE